MVATILGTHMFIAQSKSFSKNCILVKTLMSSMEISPFWFKVFNFVKLFHGGPNVCLGVRAMSRVIRSPRVAGVCFSSCRCYVFNASRLLITEPPIQKNGLQHPGPLYQFVWYKKISKLFILIFVE